MLKQLIVGENDAGQRLDRFLIKSLGLTIGVIMKGLRNKDIKIAGKPAKADYRVNRGDVIRVYADINTAEKPADFKKIAGGINIVYEDSNILLTDKPPGLLCHEGDGGLNTPDTLINRIKSYLYRKGEFVPDNENSFEPALCNRIDRNTGGLVIAAKNAETLRILNEKIRLREVKKYYLCVLAGIPDVKEATLTAYLEKDEKSNTVRISGKKTPSNKTIITKYKILGEKDGLSLAEVELITGRTHQIRAHMAYIGYPLLGDGKYGDGRVNRLYRADKQALHSYKLMFGFKSACKLDYLNGKTFRAGDAWFLKLFGVSRDYIV